MVDECENIEFKLIFTDKLYKKVIAFANSGGGKILVGVDNDGKIEGILDIDETYNKITNGIRDAINPDVTMFIKYSLTSDKVIEIEVGEGLMKPYYLKSKGIKPSGVFVRQGASTAQASFDQIRAMIKDSDGDAFELMRSMDQDLTFNSAKEIFSSNNIEFSEIKYKALGIVLPKEQIYSNLGLIISDQCIHSIKIAVFSDEEKTNILDRKEFTGSVFKQMEKSYDYLALCNKNNEEINGLERIDNYGYPEEALREALLNAIIHRDYSYSGSIIININNKEIEFISIGGLLPGLTLEDIKAGISQPRNKGLSEIFHRLRLVESYGIGIRKIFSLYSNNPIKPRIEITNNTFKLILPNMNCEKETTNISSPQINMVLDYIDKYNQINDLEIQNLLNIKKTRVFVITKEMKELGLIKSIGRGTNKVYIRN